MMLHPSLVLADDHSMFRAGLRRLLEEHHYRIIGEASTGREAVTVVQQTQPDIALLDFSMPELTGLEASSRVLHERPGVKIVILSMHRHESYVLQALQQGIHAYVVKDSAFHDLVQALESVQAGKTYISPAAMTGAIQEFLSHRHRANGPTPLQQLTPRERELFQLIAEGKSTKGIAGELGISVKTAETHRAHLMRKLRLHSVAEVVHAAVQWGIIQL